MSALCLTDCQRSAGAVGQVVSSSCGQLAAAASLAAAESKAVLAPAVAAHVCRASPVVDSSCTEQLQAASPSPPLPTPPPCRRLPGPAAPVVSSDRRTDRQGLFERGLDISKHCWVFLRVQPATRLVKQLITVWRNNKGCSFIRVIGLIDGGGAAGGVGLTPVVPAG